MHFRMRRSAVRLALLALLLAALAPAVSRMLGGGTVVVWADVCRSAGDDRAPAVEHALQHCVFCSTQAPAMALPPAGGTTAALAGFAHERPRRVVAAATAPPPWQLAVARAPPAVA